uniref:Hsp70 family protein n=1 Tax=Thermodesulfitimonas autotrophica TaxID=1894989 RepID=UPI002FDF3FBD
FTTAADNQTTVEIHVLQGERPMAADNKSLGRFHLIGIPPAPRGVPQIEVTFDIDVNGIVNVSAKDLGTGKAQSITITGSTRLSEEEIQRMVKDAERHAEEDRKRKEAAELRNQAETMVYQAEKVLKDFREKADKSQVERLEAAVKELKEALAGNDAALIKQKLEALTEPLHTLTAEMYRQAASSASNQTAGGPGQGGRTMDADYEVK